MRKIFKVTIDNNPGAWKSGEDRSYLVIAETKDEAIQIIKTGKWGEKLEYDENHNYSYAFGYDVGDYKMTNKPYISNDAQF